MIFTITRQLLLGALVGIALFFGIIIVLMPASKGPASGATSVPNPLSGWSFVTIQSGADLLKDAAALLNQNTERVGRPLWLSIPKLHVDAPVEYVGLTQENAMEVPKYRGDVAWFQPGARPGENGSAVMAGHYGVGSRSPSVFDNLFQLRKDDAVFVVDDIGTVHSFVVREIRSFEKNADTTEVFISNDGNSHLNLITCEGEWMSADQGYPKRLVVFTDNSTP